MKLWLISQESNDNYDTFDSAIVAAKTETEARNTTPYEKPESDEYGVYAGTWVAPEKVTVEYIGTAKPGTKAGVVLASFNAG